MYYYLLNCGYQNGWVVEGFLPKVESQSEKNTQAYQKCKTMLYNTCLDAFFAPLIQSFNEGGFWLRLFGRERCFLPVLAFFAQDSKEGNAMAGCYGTHNCTYPCRICWTPREHISSPRKAMPGKLRFQDFIFRAVDPMVVVGCVAMMYASTKSRDVDYYN